MGILSVFIVQRCVHTCMYRRLTSAAMRDIRLYELYMSFKKVSKIVFYEMLTMLGINFTIKT